MNRVRTPVSAFRGDTGDTVVVMDDGAAFRLRRFSGDLVQWVPLPPIPGTIEAQIQAEPPEAVVRDSEPVIRKDYCICDSGVGMNLSCPVCGLSVLDARD